MVPDFRRDGVWTPAFAGVTFKETFYEIIKLNHKKGVQNSIKGNLETVSFWTACLDPQTLFQKAHRSKDESMGLQTPAFFER
jgi:hypothetical protein